MEKGKKGEIERSGEERVGERKSWRKGERKKESIDGERVREKERKEIWRKDKRKKERRDGETAREREEK